MRGPRRRGGEAVPDHAGEVALAVRHTRQVRISVAADELTGIAVILPLEIRERGHDVLLHGALADEDEPDWVVASAAAAQNVVDGHADQAIVCCWTGTGAAIAANKLPGVRAALCGDAVTAAGARRWNDANVLALSLRSTADAELGEILDAWFGTDPSDKPEDQASIARLGELEGAG
jgi:ribose 5-phosphate isomerase B